MSDVTASLTDLSARDATHDAQRLANLRDTIKTLPNDPGIYRMLDASGAVLYVGKAKVLKNRVNSYVAKQVDSPKTRALVARIAAIEVTITASETEALLLEQTLIKSLKPPFNILLRDDKSYPSVLLTEGDDWPRLSFHRGTKRKKGRYFGPFPSSVAVRDSLNLLQKLFQVRQCEDSFFRNRARPCLQHQIGRCRAPCVGLVSDEDYRRDVMNTRLFLEGRNAEVTDNLIARMEMAAETLDFEAAARYRDQLSALRRVQEQQFVLSDVGSADVFGVAAQPGGVCVSVLQVREGRVLGSKSWHPSVFGETAVADILSEFLPSYYLQIGGGRVLPREIIVPVDLADDVVLADALRQQFGREIDIKSRVRETRAAWLTMAQRNAESALTAKLSHRGHTAARFAELQRVLALAKPIARMECFDISHTMGEATVASCVVFDAEGPRVKDYRRFNIDGITPGDDYAAMHQALMRRYSKLGAADERLPDVLFIDGGKGQLRQAIEVFETLGITSVQLVSIAKGEGRKPGLETLHFPDREPLNLDAQSLALHLTQHIRDEAHRFAITGHRARRAKARKTSSLEGIDGVGPARRRALIQHFGGLPEVLRASAHDLARVSGISESLAQTIYAALHSH
ncbi:excinuclease ABC subunit C [Paraperlucidibaca baekdonensis]|uniref:UvrABC system protein C n=1 Tax=Paraperlucidibaca baekdonensis TaxID=748120 RepID=A0A3E0H5U4_9GAMM|nr:excinuclease ABC subunit UvrC [Paraperlucidibaca baekdonensis]REH38893.1 excinuclease ABC subunit C [Paraperlucidibaca baekdonensis]